MLKVTKPVHQNTDYNIIKIFHLSSGFILQRVLYLMGDNTLTNTVLSRKENVIAPGAYFIRNTNY